MSIRTEHPILSAPNREDDSFAGISSGRFSDETTIVQRLRFGVRWPDAAMGGATGRTGENPAHNLIRRASKGSPCNGGEAKPYFCQSNQGAFTLIELMVVIVIIGILATVGLPAIRGMTKSNATISATRQLLDDIAFARRSAIANHSTVYMVFVPTNILDYGNTGIPAVDTQISNLYTKQYTTYAIVAARSVGDQPGTSTPRYLTDWRSLPNGVFIDPSKYIPLYKTTILNDYIRPFPRADNSANRLNLSGLYPNIPFPSALSPIYTTTLPYIGFDYLGRLNSPNNEGEAIPLARGSIFYDANNVADVLETPLTNSITESNVIHIDWLTGRARLERQEVQ